VGIDRDYDRCGKICGSHDQRLKRRWRRILGSRLILSSLARQSEIDDFSKAEPVHVIDPLVIRIGRERIGNRKRGNRRQRCARSGNLRSAGYRYYLVYATEYLMTSEDRDSHESDLCRGEAGMNTLAQDGMPLNHLFSAYAPKPADLPNVDAVRQGLNVCGQRIDGLACITERAGLHRSGIVRGAGRGSTPSANFGAGDEWIASAYIVPADCRADAGEPGRQSDWSGRIGARVLPASVSVVDDPTAKDFHGTPLIGSDRGR